MTLYALRRKAVDGWHYWTGTNGSGGPGTPPKFYTSYGRANGAKQNSHRLTQFGYEVVEMTVTETAQ